MDTLASRLQELMRSHGFKSQSQLARHADVPQSSIHRILHRSGYSPSLETLARLADAFGVSLSWLAHGKGPARPRLAEVATSYLPSADAPPVGDVRLSEAMTILQGLDDTERSQVLAVLRLIGRPRPGGHDDPP